MHGVQNRPIVEQFDQKPLNRAKLLNIGFKYANRLGFPCVVLSNVDLMPMNLGQLYVCSWSEEGL